MTPNFDTASLKLLSVLNMSWDTSEDICRRRNFCALSYRIHGNAVFTSADSHFEVGTGDLVYIPKGVDYISKHESENIIAIHFVSDVFPSSPFCVKASPKCEFGGDFGGLFNTYIEKEPHFEYKMLSQFYGILWKICENGGNKPYHPLTRAEECAEKAAAIIRKSFRSCDFSISELCRTLGVSGAYLRRVFTECKGISPSEYTSSLRLDYASELLGSEYCPIAAISAMSGFSDPKYFSRFISRHTGMSPSEYRKHLSEKQRF